MDRTYQIKFQTNNEPFRRRVLRFGVLAIECAVVWTLLSLTPLFRSLHEGMLDRILSGLVMGVFFAILFPLATKSFRQYELHVSEDCVKADYGYYTRTIYKRELKTIRENSDSVFRPAALILSKYGPFGTKMLGFIWIPRQCADYDEIRSLAFEWQQQAKSS